MDEEKNPQTAEKVLLTWTVPEFEKHERTKNWYVVAIALAAGALFFSFYTANFLFAVIILITALVLFLNDSRHPSQVKIQITNLGIRIGSRLNEYEEIKNFSILYKPQEELKSLYFEFINNLKPRLSLSLDDQNPLAIREILLKYLDEDLDRVNPPISEAIAKILKL